MFEQNFSVSGMTCGGCEAKVTSLFKSLNGVTEAIASKDNNSVAIKSSRKISKEEVTALLPEKYKLESATLLNNTENSESDERSWFEIYKPILLIFGLITAVTLTIQFRNLPFDFQSWMRHFMAAFFLVFSFFKLLNLSSFADSYSMYDIIAKKWNKWGYVYAFLELMLGFAYLLDCCPFATNLVTFIVMSISLIGVLQSVMNKKKIQCACLGAVFNLPMSTVTIIEDGLMILMSGLMILQHWS